MIHLLNLFLKQTNLYSFEIADNAPMPNNLPIIKTIDSDNSENEKYHYQEFINNELVATVYCTNCFIDEVEFTEKGKAIMFEILGKCFILWHSAYWLDYNPIPQLYGNFQKQISHLNWTPK